MKGFLQKLKKISTLQLAFFLFVALNFSLHFACKAMSYYTRTVILICTGCPADIHEYSDEKEPFSEKAESSFDDFERQTTDSIRISE